MGVDIEEAATQVGVLANNGLKGSLATRALGSALVGLTKPSAEAKRAIDKFGLDFFDEGQFVGITDTVKQLEAAFVGLTPEMKQNALVSIFGKEAIQEFNILLKAGSSELESYEATIRSASESNGEFAQSVREQQLDNVRGALLGLSSAYEALQISIAEGSLPAIKGFINIAADAVRAIAGLIDGSRSLEDVFGNRLGSIFGSLIDSLQTVWDSMLNLVSVFFTAGSSSDELANSVGGDLLNAFEAWSVIIQVTYESLAFAIDIIAEVIKFVRTLSREIVEISANGLQKFNLALASLFGLEDEMQQFTNSVKESFSSSANEAAKSVTAIEYLRVAYDLLKGDVAKNFAEIGKLISNFSQSLALQAVGIKDIIAGIFTLDGDQIEQGLQAVLDSVPALFEGVAEAGSKAFVDTVTKRTAGAFADTVKNLEGDYKELFRVIDAGASLVIDVGDAIYEVNSVREAIELTNNLSEKGAEFEVNIRYPDEAPVTRAGSKNW